MTDPATIAVLSTFMATSVLLAAAMISWGLRQSRSNGAPQ
jgi:hypothetical protein